MYFETAAWEMEKPSFKSSPWIRGAGLGPDNYQGVAPANGRDSWTSTSSWTTTPPPTSASWINQAERWFAELTRKQLQRGAHTSTRQLEADIRAFIEQHNEDPRPFKWTKSADDILAAVKRFCLRVDQNLCHEL